MVRRPLSSVQKRTVLARYHHVCANTQGAVHGWHCPLKGVALTIDTAQFDHIVELADGGADELSNFQPLCACCHDQKTRASIRQRAAMRMDTREVPAAPVRCSRHWRKDWETFRNSAAWSPANRWQEEYVRFVRWSEYHGKKPPSKTVFRTAYVEFMASVQKTTEPMDCN